MNITVNACTRSGRRHAAAHTARNRAGRAYCVMCMSQNRRERAVTGAWIGAAVSGVPMTDASWRDNVARFLRK